MSPCQNRQGAQGGGEPQHQAVADEFRLQEQLRHITHKLLVMSGKGGVGKTQ